MSKRCCASCCFNSQLNTKETGITYHGLPKDEIFSVIWASQAGRSDLVEMPPDKRSKYYLCSEHFTPDCFVDPARTKIRKTLHPLSIATPTLFKNNLEEVTTQLKNNSQNYIQYNRKVNKGIKFSSCAPGMVQCEEVDESELPTQESLRILKQETYILSEDVIVEEIHDEILESMDNSKNFEELELLTCRLCCNEIHSEEEIIKMFEEDSSEFTEEAMSIGSLLPNKLIEKDDGSSQVCCVHCILKLNECLSTLQTMIMNQNFKPCDS